MPIIPDLQHFKDGISKIRQWTGADHKQLQQVFIGGLIGITTNHCVLHAACSLVDFFILCSINLTRTPLEKL
jgi:hypothetical protein